MNKNYKEQIVVFIDLLGFKAAFDQGRQELILELLLLMANMRGGFKANLEESGNGTKIVIIPEVSVFSDNIVLSIPVEETENIMSASHEYIIFHNLCQYISFIATNALNAGFLVRGGIAIGKLYHKNGVVFGDALIEAYSLESKTAVYPRVIISNSVLSYCTKRDERIWLNSLNITKDFDDLPILNYISSTPNIITSGLVIEHESADNYSYIKDIKLKMNLFDNVIATNIGLANDFPDVLKKWNYFKKQYEVVKKHQLHVIELCCQNNPALRAQLDNIC